MHRSRYLLAIGGVLLLLGLGAMDWTLVEKKHIQIRYFASKEIALAYAAPAWGDPVNGVRVGLNIMGIKEIGYSSGGVLSAGPMGSTHMESTQYIYPPKGTMPHLLVRAWVENVSDKTVYLIGNKPRNGTQGPAFLLIQAQAVSESPKILNIHPESVERQQARELRPGDKGVLLEYIPYSELVSLAPDGKIAGVVSIVNVEPERGNVVKADAVATSGSLVPPWDLFRLYFDIVQ